MTIFTELLFWVIGTIIFWTTLLSIFKFASSLNKSSFGENQFPNRVTCKIAAEDIMPTSSVNDVKSVVPYHYNEFHKIYPVKLEKLTYISISRRIPAN